jgi:phosphatidylserine decarboxylase
VISLLSQRALGERALVDAFQRAPLGWFTGVVGWIARRRLPRPVRRPLYGAYARYYDVDLDEAELPLEDYPSFGDFFARRLRPGLRDGAADPDAVTAPCDGTLAARGEASDDQLIQAKGRDYRLSELVADDELAGALRGGSFLTFYLSPRDYHRVHSPVDGQLTGFTWIPGRHLPVSSPFVRGVDQLFSRNERVVLRIETDGGPVALVMVAAAGVANVSVTAAGVDSRAFRAGGVSERFSFDQPISIDRGAELGAFHLGSTVVVIFPPGAVELAIDPSADDLRPVRVGETIASRNRAAGRAQRVS